LVESSDRQWQAQFAENGCITFTEFAAGESAALGKKSGRYDSHSIDDAGAESYRGLEEARSEPFIVLC
jgi:hypothetical protein